MLLAVHDCLLQLIEAVGKRDFIYSGKWSTVIIVVSENIR
jgi:hypothetical protein